MKTKKYNRNFRSFSKLQIQKAFDAALSRPKWIIVPPHIDEDVSHVSKAALQARCNQRIKELAQPHPRNIYKPPVKPCNVNKNALKAQPTEWNNKSALPKLRNLYLKVRDYIHLYAPMQKHAAKHHLKQLKENFKGTHPSAGVQSEHMVEGAVVHVKCLPAPIDDKQYICQLNKKDRKEFQMRMIRMGMPKPKLKPPKPPRGPKKFLKDFANTLKRLAEPNTVIQEKTVDPYAVKKGALTYGASDRIQNLAKPRESPPLPLMYDFRGNILPPRREWNLASRQRVVASERTNELAMPKAVKPKAVEAVKENPFAVCKAALTAACSQRTAELAIPIKRKFKKMRS